MAKATTRSINAALRRAGIDAEFCNNRDGYSYFIGPDVEYAPETSVYVCYVGDLSVDQWVEYARGFMTESAARNPANKPPSDFKLKIKKAPTSSDQ
jgi:transposase